MDDSKSDNLENCCSEVEIDPFLTFKTTEFNFGMEYFKTRELLENLIVKNRKRIQTIRVKWGKGIKKSKKVEVYATPIKGVFCFCGYHWVGRQRTGYQGRVALPHSDFEYFEQFWDSNEGELFKREDFSQMDYDIIR